MHGRRATLKYRKSLTAPSKKEAYILEIYTLMVENLKTLLLALLVIIILALPLPAEEESGMGLLLLGESAASLGRGGTGVSSFGIDLFFLNPASIAATERFGLSIQYGSLDNSYTHIGGALAMPTSYGVLGTGYRTVRIPEESEDIETGQYGSLGGSKFFTRNLALGIGIDIFSGKTESEIHSWAGMSLGGIYRFQMRKKYSGGFGFHLPAIGFSAFGGSSSTSEGKDLNRCTLGYSFLFYRHHNIQIGFFNDYSMIRNFTEHPLKAGLESKIFNNYIIRTGCSYPGAYGYGNVTFGLGYLFEFENFEGSLDYAIVHHKNFRFVHYAGLSAKFGSLDREPPDVSIDASEQSISPNFDGRQDYVLFKTDVSDRSAIKGWRLQILNSEKNLIKDFQTSERNINAPLSIPGFIARIWHKRESTMVPGRILWDGTNAEGKTVPDGKYRYSFIVWDERDNISIARKGIIQVDNTPPAITAKAPELLFSPNGDGRKDTLKITITLKASSGDQWKYGFKDSEGNLVQEFTGTGAALPGEIRWKGTNPAGEKLPEGLYSFYIESSDKAGNRTEQIIRGISLTRKYQTAEITASSEYFAYRKGTTISFFLSLSDKTGLTDWSIIIEDDDEEIVRTIAGKSSIPRMIPWDVTDSHGKQLKDGKYYFYLKSRFSSGNQPLSFKKELVIDTIPPELSLSYSPNLFSPDNDGRDDLLVIDPRARDDFGIREWFLLVYAPSGNVFKTFKGKGAPGGSIIWDGRGKNNELVESASDYYLELFATDTVGNMSRSNRYKLPIDILVLVTEQGLKIRISNVEFKLNKSKLRGKAFAVLDRVVYILQKYNTYKVIIVGHTDDIGEEEYNLALSEKRAKAVMDYLVEEGVSKKRFSFRGMGETEPFLPNSNTDNRRRNRRVEFLLIKDLFIEE